MGIDCVYVVGGVLHACGCTWSVMLDSVTPWTVAHQAPMSMEFSRQEYWSGLTFPPPGDLPNSGIKPVSPALVGGIFTSSSNWDIPITQIEFSLTFSLELFKKFKKSYS